MKKFFILAVSILILAALTLSACGSITCHRCGDPVGKNPVKAGGRTYCSYDCYMHEAMFD